MPDAGRYRIERLIGRGGMGEVMEGYVRGEGGFERKVAIKRMLADCASDEMFLRSFADEARIVSQLHHANIVGVFDFGLMDGLPFLVFEHVDGLDIDALEERCRELGRTITAEIALHITTEIAHALDYAHGARDREGRSMRLVHRDVSPENILVSWQGDVKLADFGIAFALRRIEATEAGVRKGKRAYMAPEQKRAGDVDGRADIFSLGCVLHRLLTRRSPLERDQGGQLVLGRGECEIEPALEADVKEIVVRATHKVREKRFATAAEMAAACGTALVRRLSRDVRTSMREWIEGLRPADEAKKQRRAFADLLDLDLVLERSEGPVPRFLSRARGAGAMAAEPFEPPHATQVTEVERGDQTVPQYHPPTTILPGSAIWPASTPRRGVTRWIQAGVLLGVAAMLGGSAMLVRATREPVVKAVGLGAPAQPPPVIRIDPIELSSPEEEPAPAPAERALAPEREPPSEGMRPRPRSPPTGRKRGAEADRRAHQSADLQHAELPISESLLREKLSRISEALSKRAATLPKAEIDRLETRYFEVRAALSPGLSDRELESLARRIRELALEVRRVRSVDDQERDARDQPER